jgi:Tol biopolymer transport system component
MGAMKQSTIETGLQRKGFTLEGNRRHRKFVFVTDSGRKTPVRTMTSHGSDKTLDSSLVSKMAQQCKLPTKDFEKMVSCRISREQYSEMLAAQGLDVA